MTMHETQPNTNSPADVAAAARAAARQGAPKPQNTQPMQPEVPKTAKTAETSPSNKGWIKFGVGAATLALVAGGVGRMLSGGGESAPEPQPPVATASQDPSAAETSEPVVESQYSAEEQAALDEIATMSIDDITGDFSPEDLDVANIVDTFRNPYDTPTTKAVSEQDLSFETTFDVNGYVIGVLASPDVSADDKTELLKRLGLSPVTLRNTLETCQRVANGELDDTYPWLDPSGEDVEDINIWRQYGASFYAAALSALQSGTKVPIASEVDSVDIAQLTAYTDTTEYESNSGELLGIDDVWILRPEDDGLVHSSMTRDQAIAASAYNVGRIKYNTPTALNFVSIYPFDPTAILLNTGSVYSKL